MLDHAEYVTWDAETLTPPVCTRYLVNEATIEKVHVILKENPQGVLYLRDELSGWMVQLEQRGRAQNGPLSNSAMRFPGTRQRVISCGIGIGFSATIS